MKKYIQEKFIRIVHIYFAETLGTTNKKPSSLFPYAKRQTHVTSQIHLVQHATHQNIFFGIQCLLLLLFLLYILYSNIK